jgi:hypothetical protein
MDDNWITIETQGFYKLSEDLSWEYAPNYVYSQDYTLLKELKDTYEYPVDGWTWYEKTPDEYIEWKLLNNKQL